VDDVTDTAAHDRIVQRIARVGLFFALVLALGLAVLMLGAKSSQATTPAPGQVSLGFEEELEEETETERGEEECEDAEEEAEEGEISAAEATAICEETEANPAPTGRDSTVSAACPIHTAHTHATERRDRLKVTVDYTTAGSAVAMIELRSDSKQIASVRRRLDRHGVLRITKRLGKQRIKRVVVRFRIASCRRVQTRSIKIG
jgi:hypothetical protein